MAAVATAATTVPARGANSSLRFLSLAALKELPPEPPWLWQGLVAKGAVTMLAGNPFAGKSMLIGGLVRALEAGESFLGLPTRRSSGLLLSEEDDAALRARCETLDLLHLASESLTRTRGVLSHGWEELIAAATVQALAHGHGLLVVDTFPGLAGLDDELENDAAAVTRRMRPLQEAAGKGLAVVFLHHMNRAGQARGSKAFKASVDISLRLLRRGSESQFALMVESRYPTSPTSVRGQLRRSQQPWQYQPLNGPARLERAEADDPDHAEESTEQRLWAALKQAGADGLRYRDIAQLPGLSKDQAKKRFPDWRQEGKLVCRGGGTRTDPLRWSIAPASSGAVHSTEKEVTAPNPFTT